MLLFSVNSIPLHSKKAYGKQELNEPWLADWHLDYNKRIVQQMIKDDKLALFHSLKSEHKQFDLILTTIRSAMRQQNTHDADVNHWTHKALMILSKVHAAGKDEEKTRKREAIDQINHTVCAQAR